MSKIEHNSNRSIFFRGSLRIAGLVLLAGGLSTVAIARAGIEQEEAHKAGETIAELMDKGGYQPFLGDMNGPDQYTQPLEEARRARDEHQDTAILYGVGGLAIACAGVWRGIQNVQALRRDLETS